MADVVFETYVAARTGATTPLAGTEVVPIVQGGTTKKIALTPANIGALPTGTKIDDLTAPDDNTDLNATTSAHGLLLKATAPASGLMSVVGIANGENAYTNKALFDATNPAALGTAAPGSAMVAARRDHVHAVPDIVGDTTPQLGGDLDLNGFQITGSGGIVTTSQPVLDLTQTWNDAAVVFTGIKANFTSTASSSASILADIQVGGVTQFSISKTGTVTLNGLISSTYRVDGGVAMRLQAAMFYGITGTTSPANAAEVAWYRDAAGIWASRVGTAAQGLRVYNTWTDASNHERGIFDWQATSNVLTIGTQAAGTGTLRAVAFVGASFAFPSAKPVGFLGATPASQQTHVADASTAHNLNATFSDTEVETALNNLGTKINSVLTTLEAFGFHATA